MQVAELCNLGSKLVAAEFSSAWKSVFAQGAENGKQFHGDQKCQSQLKKGESLISSQRPNSSVKALKTNDF